MAVMGGLVPAIHVLIHARHEDVDARHVRKRTAKKLVRQLDEKKRREVARMLAKIRRIQADARKHMKPSDFLTDDDIYDEFGLPKPVRE